MVNELQLLSAFFMHTSEGILVTDRDGYIVLINPRAEVMFAYAPSELVGEPVEVLIPRDAASRHVQHRNNYHQNPHPRSMGEGMVLYARRKNNTTFPVEISLSHVQADDNSYVVCFVVDITERKAQDDALRSAHADLERRVQDRTEELRSALEQLEESRRDVIKALEKERELNRLKSRFVTTASHEFRTPLGTILSSAALISRYNAPQDEEKRIKHTERIKASVGQLNELLNEFLSLERLEEGAVRAKPELIPLCDFILSTIDDIRPLAKEGQTIDCRELEKYDSHEVWLDKQLLKIILNNLISNAIKYSPPHSAIEVVVAIDSQEYSISVHDKGIGIPSEDKPFLFERFFRAHNATNIQGTGLGLNIVKRYAEVMGGSVDYWSEVGKGSVFTVTFQKEP